MKTWEQLQYGIFGMLLTASATAGPADYVLTPKVEQGELELDVSYGAASANAGARPQVASLGLGYGVSERWFSEVALKLKNGGAADSDYLEWENKIKLTPVSATNYEVGFVTELEAPLQTGAPWEVKLGPLFQTYAGAWQLNANVLFERAFGHADEHGAAYVTNLGYQWQVRQYRKDVLAFGVQGFGELGQWDRWDGAAQQNHRAGPALFGKLPFGGEEPIKFNAAWLFGVSQAAPRNTLRIQLEREL
ncbi:MAG: hypothetical protein PHW66_03090 [Gallionella sp.]|nr:hypothetical protein [Gallionella sp.]